MTVPNITTAESISPTSIQVWWTAAQSEGDIEIVTFRIEYTGTEADFELHTTNIPVEYLTTVPYTSILYDLEEADTYKIKISASNHYGHGPYSPIFSIKTLEASEHIIITSIYIKIIIVVMLNKHNLMVIVIISIIGKNCAKHTHKNN